MITLLKILIIVYKYKIEVQQSFSLKICRKKNTKQLGIIKNYLYKSDCDDYNNSLDKNKNITL